MRGAFLLALPAFLALASSPCPAAEAKPRVLVLTDIENEPDDAMSMVRFLVYANQWDVEGLVATTSVHQQDQTAAWRIREIVEAYTEVRENLLLHEGDRDGALTGWRSTLRVADAVSARRSRRRSRK